MNPFASSRGRGGAAAVWLGFAPGTLLFVLVALVPAAAVLPLSLTDVSGVPNAPWHVVGLDNYVRFFTGGQAEDNIATLVRTAVFCLAVTVVQTALALALALLLDTRLAGRAVLRAVVFLPSVLGVTVIGLIWSLVLDADAGPVAAFLRAIGHPSALLGDPHLAFGLVILVQMWASVGYAVVIFLAGLQTLPAELLEAAVLDGAGTWQRFRHVTLRLLAPSVTANVLIAIIGSLQSYQLVYVLTGGRADTRVLALQVLESGFGTGSGSAQRPQEQGYASAASVLQFVLIAVVSLVALAVLRRREVDL
jgi:raffinose/stachyose/melibiose transport system permease protein